MKLVNESLYESMRTYDDRIAGRRGTTTRDCHTFGPYKDHDNLVNELDRFF